MKKLNTETTEKGINTARVHDYQSGVELGKAQADWDQYRAWAEGPSDVCEARRCLSVEEMSRLGIAGDTVIFLLEDLPTEYRYEISKKDIGSFRNTMLSEQFSVLDPDGFTADEATGDAVIAEHGWSAEKTAVEDEA